MTSPEHLSMVKAAQLDPNAPIAADSFRAIMQHQAGAVSIVATGAEPDRAGLTATAIASLSDEPPSILVCVNRKTDAHDAIPAGGSFAVNLLAADQQNISDRFAGRDDQHGEDRFKNLAGMSWGTLKTGAPVLHGALAVLDCTLTDQHAFTTHTIYIGQVVAGVFREDARPLLYFRGDYWDLGQK